jgi:uncharacterized membrane protein
LGSVSGTARFSPRTPQLNVRSRPRLGLALTIGAAIWVTAIVWLPSHVHHGASPIVAAAVYGAGALLCHQRPERSFHGRDAQFPVCARCTALYVGALVGALMAWFGATGVPHRVAWILACAALPTAVSLAVELAGVAAPSNVSRAFAALPLGAAAGWIVVRMLREPGEAHAL